jgi:hypothetical protein
VSGTPRDYRCDRCGTEFLPFRSGVACPSCSVPAGEELPIVHAVFEAYAANLDRFGTGVPPTIAVGSLWDDYLYRGLFFLRALDGRRPRESEESVLERALTSVEGSKGPGWRGHIEDFYRSLLRARRGTWRSRRDARAAERPEREK